VSRKNTTEENLIAFDMNGETRQYILHRPDGLQENSPLVFVLHGLGGSASGIREYSRMDKVADENGFAVCYPQGTGGSEDTKYTKKGTHFWNVGYEVHKNETVDDVEFITSLAMFLQEKYNLDSEKTFCTGMSNGGDMSYLLGCAAPDIFKAIAPITGCMMKWIYDSCNENDPVPVFHVHGTADHTTYYDGDEENRDEWGAYMGVERTINLWIERNECSNTSVDTLPDIDKNDGSIVIAQKNTGGKNNNEVWFYKVIGGDHEWPQGWPKNSGNQDLNTSAEIWNFFQHSMKN
jgi:polyhydroxybutyrate depolymerase